MALQRKGGELDEGNYCLNKNCFDSASLNLLVQIRLPATLVVHVGALSSEYWHQTCYIATLYDPFQSQYALIDTQRSDSEKARVNGKCQRQLALG